ncbi:TetR/AcrR family transcriptional regulator [Kineococcus sp. G2]|uniref:TetR/AcrR family transcriptional regulator n=1 Tax=Kineococcus sp. G2 TaxID=3127484 RepID=UPI00301E5A4D
MPGPGGRADEFAGAALRVVARGGLQAVSVRTVAAEAGWSAGALQKVFPTKEDLLRAAVDLMDRRVRDRTGGTTPTGDPVEDLAALVEETLPLDAHRREESLVWTAFALEGARTPWIADVLRTQDDTVTADLAPLVGEDVARAVTALADGFAVRLLYDPGAADAVRAALRTALTALLTGTTPP